MPAWTREHILEPFPGFGNQSCILSYSCRMLQFFLIFFFTSQFLPTMFQKSLTRHLCGTFQRMRDYSKLMSSFTSKKIQRDCAYQKNSAWESLREKQPWTEASKTFIHTTITQIQKTKEEHLCRNSCTGEGKEVVFCYMTDFMANLSNQSMRRTSTKA